LKRSAAAVAAKVGEERHRERERDAGVEREKEWEAGVERAGRGRPERGGRHVVSERVAQGRLGGRRAVSEGGGERGREGSEETLSLYIYSWRRTSQDDRLQK
jgi:hypothetical protein